MAEELLAILCKIWRLHALCISCELIFFIYPEWGLSLDEPNGLQAVTSLNTAYFSVTITTAARRKLR